MHIRILIITFNPMQYKYSLSLSLLCLPALSSKVEPVNKQSRHLHSWGNCECDVLWEESIFVSACFGALWHVVLPEGEDLLTFFEHVWCVCDEQLTSAKGVFFSWRTVGVCCLLDSVDTCYVHLHHVEPLGFNTVVDTVTINTWMNWPYIFIRNSLKSWGFQFSSLAPNSDSSYPSTGEY